MNLIHHIHIQGLLQLLNIKVNSAIRLDQVEDSISTVDAIDLVAFRVFIVISVETAYTCLGGIVKLIVTFFPAFVFATPNDEWCSEGGCKEHPVTIVFSQFIVVDRWQGFGTYE